MKNIPQLLSEHTQTGFKKGAKVQDVPKKRKSPLDPSFCLTPVYQMVCPFSGVNEDKSEDDDGGVVEVLLESATLTTSNNHLIWAHLK